MDDSTSVTAGDVRRLTIEDIAFGGDGVARTEEGAVVFVPFTVCGDVIDARVTMVHRSFLRAEVVSVLKPGSGRVSPPCPYYGVCGGCSYQHMDVEHERAAKVSQLQDVLQRIGCVSDVPVPEPVVASPRSIGYRNKIRLEPICSEAASEGDAASELEYGYCARDNVTTLPIARCLLAAEPLNGLLRKVGRTAWGRKNARRPHPFPVTLRMTRSGSTHLYFGRAPRSIPWLHEELLGRDISVPLGSFWQVNHEVADALAETVSSWYRDAPTRALVDAYSGVGTFSLAAGDAAQYRVLIENDAQALEAARYNHDAWDGLKCRCIHGRVERELPVVLRNVDCSETTVILDPPRSGCGRKVIRTLCRLKPARLLYVSCNASTFARDVKSLVSDGSYHLDRLALFDMFPRTSHFETLGLLRLRASTE